MSNSLLVCMERILKTERQKEDAANLVYMYKEIYISRARLGISLSDNSKILPPNITILKMS